MQLRMVLWTSVVCFMVGCSQVPADSHSDAASEGEETASGATTATAYATATKKAIVIPSAADGDWPWWRGPNRNGIAQDGQPLPLTWSDTENVIWKTNVSGRGHSSPTVFANRIYLATADERRQIQSVLAFDRQTGTQVWKTDVNRGGFPRRIHQKNTHASGTVACDGEHIFVTFFNNQGIQATALNLAGKQVWQEVIGPFQPRTYQYGYAASPTIYQGLVIIAADYEGGGYLAGLDRKTGRTIWKTSRPAKLSYSSPIVANVAGRDQLLISGCDLVAAFDPLNGNKLWSTNATTMATCGTMVWDGNLVFASGGFPKAETVCVRIDGNGGRVLWTNRQKCYEQSILVQDGYVYAVNDQGIALCWRADDGSQMWRARLSGPISASPVLAGGHIYASNERGTTYVFKANPQGFEKVAENQLGQISFATPTICGGRIFLRVAQQSGGRRQEFLYCIGKES